MTGTPIALLLVDRERLWSRMYPLGGESDLKQDALERSKRFGCLLDVFGVYYDRDIEFFFTIEYNKRLEVAMVQIVKRAFGPYASPLKDERTIFCY